MYSVLGPPYRWFICTCILVCGSVISVIIVIVILIFSYIIIFGLIHVFCSFVLSATLPNPRSMFPFGGPILLPQGVSNLNIAFNFSLFVLIIYTRHSDVSSEKTISIHIISISSTNSTLITSSYIKIKCLLELQKILTQQQAKLLEICNFHNR
jgi:hypothetical protein